MIWHHSYFFALHDLEDLRQRSLKKPFKVVFQDNLFCFCDEVVCCIQRLGTNLKGSYIFSNSKKTAHVQTGWKLGS